MWRVPDPLSIRSGFTQPERRLLWKVREDLTGISSALPKLLRCVSWHRIEQRKIVHALLKRWVNIDPEHTLQVDCDCLVVLRIADDVVHHIVSPQGVGLLLRG